MMKYLFACAILVAVLLLSIQLSVIKNYETQLATMEDQSAVTSKELLSIAKLVDENLEHKRQLQATIIVLDGTISVLTTLEEWQDEVLRVTLERLELENALLVRDHIILTHCCAFRPASPIFVRPAEEDRAVDNP